MRVKPPANRDLLTLHRYTCWTDQTVELLQRVTPRGVLFVKGEILRSYSGTSFCFGWQLQHAYMLRRWRDISFLVLSRAAGLSETLCFSSCLFCLFQVTELKVELLTRCFRPFEGSVLSGREELLLDFFMHRAIYIYNTMKETKKHNISPLTGELLKVLAAISDKCQLAGSKALINPCKIHIYISDVHYYMYNYCYYIVYH